jgi:hypothetical protein
VPDPARHWSAVYSQVTETPIDYFKDNSNIFEAFGGKNDAFNPVDVNKIVTNSIKEETGLEPGNGPIYRVANMAAGPVNAIDDAVSSIDWIVDPVKFAFNVKDEIDPVLSALNIVEKFQKGQAEEVVKEIARIIKDGGDPHEFAIKSWAKYTKITGALEVGGNTFSLFTSALDLISKTAIALDPNGNYNWGDSVDLVAGSAALGVAAMAATSNVIISTAGVSMVTGGAALNPGAVAAAPYVAAVLGAANLTKKAAEWEAGDTLDAGFKRDIESASSFFSSFSKNVVLISNDLFLGKITEAEAASKFEREKAFALNGLSGIEDNISWGSFSGSVLNMGLFLTGDSGDLTRVKNVVSSLRPGIDSISWNDLASNVKAKKMAYEIITAGVEIPAK